MTPGEAPRPVAQVRAQVYADLAAAFRLPAPSRSRGLRRLITALGHVLVWHPYQQLEEQLEALRLWLQEPDDGLTAEHGYRGDESALQTVIDDLQRMVALCTQEGRAWVMSQDGVARDCLLSEHRHLQALQRSLAGLITAEAGEGVCALLVRIARQYVVFDARVVAAVLVASGYAPAEV